jgi:hypothetical protein
LQSASWSQALLLLMKAQVMVEKERMQSGCPIGEFADHSRLALAHASATGSSPVALWQEVVAPLTS